MDEDRQGPPGNRRTSRYLERRAGAITLRRTFIALAVLFLLASAALFGLRYGLAESNRKTLKVSDVKAMPSKTAVYRNINNWKTIANTKWKGVQVTDLLKAAGVTDPEATLRFYAPDGYFWPALKTDLTVADMSKANSAGLLRLIGYQEDGKTLSAEPDGTGPLRYVAPQYSTGETNKPSWVQNLRMIVVGPLKKGEKLPSAKKVSTNELVVFGRVSTTYPFGIVFPILAGALGLLFLVVALVLPRKKKVGSHSTGVNGAAVTIVLLLACLLLWPAPDARAADRQVVFNMDQLKAMQSVTGRYTFLKQLPPYTYYEDTYTGVPLSVLLDQKVGVGAGAAKMIAHASDGYTAELTLDLARATCPGGLVPIIAYAKDGKALPGEEGPLRLIVPQQKQGTRDQGGDANTPLCGRMIRSVEIAPTGVTVDPAAVPAGSLSVYGNLGTPQPAPAPAPAPAPTPAATPTPTATPTPAAQTPAAAAAANTPVMTPKRIKTILSLSIAGEALDSVACWPLRLVTRGTVTALRTWP